MPATSTQPLPQITVAVSFNLPADAPVADLPTPQWLAHAIRHGLTQLLPDDAPACQISLLIADDHAVRELNRRYRGIDQTTDVLSFSAHHPGPWQGDDHPPPTPDDAAADDDTGPPHDFFPIPAGEPPPLGDIIISLPQATRQAARQGIPLRRELALLLAHGALHLLGCDHDDPADQAAMQAHERAALAAIFPGPCDADADASQPFLPG